MNVRLQPPHASLIGGDQRSSSGSLVKFTVMRRASSCVAERCDAAIRPESGEKRKCAGCAETTSMTLKRQMRKLLI